MAQELGAHGVRMIIDVRRLRESQLDQPLRRFSQAEISVCLTLRWKDTNNASSAWDEPPSPAEGLKIADTLIAALNSPEGKSMSGRLWIQFYNEIAGGPGRFRHEHADRMFEWATHMSQRMRKHAPHVKIAGPALTNTGVLDDRTLLNDRKRAQRDLLLRAIEWSAEHADAVDLHLHVRDGRTAQARLRRIRSLLDEKSAGRNVGLVVMEWSCAPFPQRDDPAAVRQTVIDIWKEMKSAAVLCAAYGGLWPPKGQGEVFQWKNLLTEDGKPNEPFYSTFKEIAAGNINGKLVDDPTDDLDGPETGDQDRPRR